MARHELERHHQGGHHHHPHDQLARLPDEILVQIFQAVAKQSRRSLCSVSRLNKRYHTLADAVLYETIHFVTPELHFIFSESLTRRPRRGSSIREIKLAYPASELSKFINDEALHSPRYHHAPFDSLSRTISAMSNLDSLDIAVPDTMLQGIGKLFDGPFDLACLTSCTLFYQCDNDQYWDLQENIHIFSHPSLETLIIKRARLDHRGFDFIEQPFETALTTLHLIECDFNDDALGDILQFPTGLKEFVMTQAAEPKPELEETSDNFEDYILALKTQSHALVTITIDLPFLSSRKALRMRDFEQLKTFRLNWDHQLFGKSSKKPRMHSVGLPPNIETLEFFNPLGTDEEVTDLLVYALDNLEVNARHLESLIIAEAEGDVKIPPAVAEAIKAHPQIHLDLI